MVQPPVLTPITLPPALWRTEDIGNPDTQLLVEASKGPRAENVDTIIELKVKFLMLRNLYSYFTKHFPVLHYFNFMPLRRI